MIVASETLIRNRSPWELTIERLRNDHPALISAAVLLAVVLVAAIAPLIAKRMVEIALIASAIFLTTSVRGQVIWASVFLVVYWLAIMLIPVPGFGAGFLEPKGNLGCGYA